MWFAVLSLLKRVSLRVWAYIALAGAILIAILVVLAKAKRAGKDEVLGDILKKEIANVVKARKVERDVAVTKPDAVRERLRKYQRD